jgi:2'-5' RNA ligase
LLDQRHSASVRNIQQSLAEAAGLSGAQLGPAHCAFHVAERYDDGAEDVVRSLVAGWSPLTLRVEGVGLFPGARPVLSLAIARGPVLAERQRDLHEAIDSLASGVDPRYHPDRWMPHITLLQAALSADQVGRAAEQLAGGDFEWRVATNRVALLDTSSDPVAVRFQISFSGAWGE